MVRTRPLRIVWSSSEGLGCSVLGRSDRAAAGMGRTKDAHVTHNWSGLSFMKELFEKEGRLQEEQLRRQAARSAELLNTNRSEASSYVSTGRSGSVFSTSRSGTDRSVSARRKHIARSGTELVGSSRSKPSTARSGKSRTARSSRSITHAEGSAQYTARSRASRLSTRSYDTDTTESLEALEQKRMLLRERIMQLDEQIVAARAEVQTERRPKARPFAQFNTSSAR